MLGLRSALTWLLPELPSWLAAEIARAEHCRREMQRKGASPRQSPPSPPSTTSNSHNDNQDQISPDTIESFDQPLDTQIAKDIIFHHIAPISPKFKKPADILGGLDTDDNISKEVTPDSPFLQVYLIPFRMNDFIFIKINYRNPHHLQILVIQCTISHKKCHHMQGIFN